MVFPIDRVIAAVYWVAGPAAWAFFLFVAWKGRARLNIRLKPTPTLEQLPSVSVIVPCRNEAAGIEACLRSLLDQDYPNFDLIVVNDRSTDTTGAVVDALAAREPRLTTMHVRDGELPEGWLGKSNALWKASAASRGEWMIFIDSDCIVAPTAVREAVANGVAREFDLVSFVPRFVSGGFWDGLMTPLCGMATGGMYTMMFANNAMQKNVAFACGQFIAIRRPVYDAIGGHAAFHDRAGEDVELARKLKKAGYRPRLGWGMDLITTRMYATWPTIYSGWGRNFIAASQGSATRVYAAAAFIVLCILSVYPALAWGIYETLQHAWEGPIWIMAAVLHALLITIAMVDGYRWARAGVGYALLWPISTIALLVIFTRSIYFAVTKQIIWRGVRYSLKTNPSGPTS